MTPFARSNDYATWSGRIADTLAVQPGDVLALITSGTYSGQLGPFNLTATDGRQTLANIKGIAIDQTSAVDSTGVQERFLPNQDGRLCTYYTRASAADANYAWIVDSDSVRKTLNAETSGATKAALADRQFNFIN